MKKHVLDYIGIMPDEDILDELDWRVWVIQIGKNSGKLLCQPGDLEKTLYSVCDDLFEPTSLDDIILQTKELDVDDLPISEFDGF